MMQPREHRCHRRACWARGDASASPNDHIRKTMLACYRAVLIPAARAQAAVVLCTVAIAPCISPPDEELKLTN